MEGRQVATVGWIEAVPGAPNVVPGEVRATLEIRDLEMAKIERVFGEIEARAGAIEQVRDVTIEFDHFYETLAAPTDPRFRDIVEASADRARLHSACGCLPVPDTTPRAWRNSDPSG